MSISSKWTGRRERGLAMGTCNIAPDGMALVAVDAAFALLGVDRIAWQVPVHQAMAPGVKVQSFLPD